MTRRTPRTEIVLMLAVVASAGATAWQFLRDGYLPQPFVFDTNDTFMDWFNTAYWANHTGAYEVWQSIYPPLSFAFLRLFSLGDCYLGSPFHARDCDWLGRGAIMVCYVVDVAMAGWAFARAGAAWPRSVAFALGLPLLFTLERGNLILACLPAFMLAYWPGPGAGRWRALGTALTINFKPYLLVPALAGAIRREWRGLEVAGLATIAVYLVTYALVGSGSPQTLLTNTSQWLTAIAGQPWNEVNYSTSYASLLMLAKAPVSLFDFVPSRVIEGVQRWVPMVIGGTQAVAAVCVAAAWVQPRALAQGRLAAVLLGAYLVGQSPGGYTQVFLLFLVLLEPWRGIGPRLAVICGYLLCLVGDWPLATILDVQSNSWLSGRPVTASFGLTVGHFLRPGLIVVMVLALSLDGIAAVVRAHRGHRPVLGLASA